MNHEWDSLLYVSVTLLHDELISSDSLVLAVGDSRAPSPTTLSSLTVEPHDLWPRPAQDKTLEAQHGFKWLFNHNQWRELLIRASLTFALSLCISALSSRCVHTGDGTVRAARRLGVETVVPRSVALAAGVEDHRSDSLKIRSPFIFALSRTCS